MNPFNFWKWPIELFEDAKQWKIVNDALKESRTLDTLRKFEYELRIDKIGRIYTVINIPEELLPYDKKDQVWPWMLEQLRELDILLMEVQLNDLIYPDVTRIEEYPAYLVILSPSTESLRLGKFIEWIFSTGFTYFVYFVLDKLATKFLGSSIYDIIYNTLF